MANLNKLAPLILKWEGGYVNDPLDRGGATNRGVTLATWRKQGYDKNDDDVIDVKDLKLIDEEDVVERIMRPHYWDRWQADQIDSQALANILVDWVWCSGQYGIAIPQAVLGVKADGIAGEKTLNAVNSHPDQEGLFEKIKEVRKAYLHMICDNRPTNKRFLKGWLNRLNDFKWIPMALLFCVLMSCRTIKTEETLQQTTTETVDSTLVASANKEYAGEQQERVTQESNEHQITEIITAVFDTFDAKPVLKELRIQRTVFDRAVHTEQQAESRIAGTETHDEVKKVTGERQTAIHKEVKKMPVQKPVVWWVAGGAIAAWVLWRWVRKKGQRNR